jgi:hypothetical protein
MINGFGSIFRACNSSLKNSVGVFLLSAESLAQDGELLAFNGFHIENCCRRRSLLSMTMCPGEGALGYLLSDAGLCRPEV